jgi:hypothetical protein
LLEDPKDVDELKRGIRYFFEEGLRQRAGNQGRRKAEAYSERANFDRMIQVFGETIDRSEASDDSPRGDPFRRMTDGRECADPGVRKDRA